MHQVLADFSVSISELKKNPSAVTGNVKLTHYPINSGKEMLASIPSPETP
jgi:hypothetical protein